MADGYPPKQYYMITPSEINLYVVEYFQYFTELGWINETVDIHSQ